VTDEVRVGRAIRAAVTVAHRRGADNPRPVVLHDSTHVTIHLSPDPVVARVGPASEPWMVRRSEREVAVAGYLAGDGAPVVAPVADGAGPHHVEGCVVTLWRYVEASDAPDAVAAGEALAHAHRSLVGYAGDLPPFTEALDDARRLLQSVDMGPLPSEDRAFLLDRYQDLRGRAEDMSPGWRPIHGDPHIGNALTTAGGVLWTDWESACLGPTEWDVACLPTAAVAAWPGINHVLLAYLRDLRSACVSAWSWALYDRSADKREAARYHLDRLKAQAGR